MSDVRIFNGDKANQRFVKVDVLPPTFRIENNVPASDVCLCKEGCKLKTRQPKPAWHITREPNMVKVTTNGKNKPEKSNCIAVGCTGELPKLWIKGPTENGAKKCYRVTKSVVSSLLPVTLQLPGKALHIIGDQLVKEGDGNASFQGFKISGKMSETQSL
jgi:hypothetical protein